MTGNVNLFNPMLGACAIAMLVPALLRNAPIYDSMRDDLLHHERRRATAAIGGEAVVADAPPQATPAP